MLVPGDGAGQTVVIDAEELRSLANAARSARSDVDHALSRIAGIMGPLDRRGWSARAADDAWLRARAGLLNLEADLEQHAAILDGRANLVDRFETRGTGSLTNQVELTAAGIPSADDLNRWEPILPLSIVPNAADPYAIEIALQREQVQQFLSPVLGIDLSNREGDPWNIALDGLKLVVSAVGDTPSDCNDAFARLAQAVPQGPDAVRDALEKSRPGCTQSRSLIRLSGVLADGTPVDVQAEATLNQFIQQMTAMADGLGGGELGGRRVNPAGDGFHAGPPSVPQGFTRDTFAAFSAKLRAAASRFGDDIAVHGSRAKGTATAASDVDVAIRVSPERFQQIADEVFGFPVGNAKARTKAHALQVGKIQRGELRLSAVGTSLEADVGVPVQISVIREAGPFDDGPFIPLSAGQ